MTLELSKVSDQLSKFPLPSITSHMQFKHAINQGKGLGRTRSRLRHLQERHEGPQAEGQRE